MIKKYNHITSQSWTPATICGSQFACDYESVRQRLRMIWRWSDVKEEKKNGVDTHILIFIYFPKLLKDLKKRFDSFFYPIFCFSHIKLVPLQHYGRMSTTPPWRKGLKQRVKSFDKARWQALLLRQHRVLSHYFQWDTYEECWHYR